jgi:hypothetical protein
LSSRSSRNKAYHNACDQKQGAKHAAEIEMMAGTVWQPPTHVGKYTELFSGMTQDQARFRNGDTKSELSV